MPRPGPRPYECVRRAWHSDRHKPMRGSIIQEIFRLANEIHSPATRKNREWQEKLPVVVLKAEEIMYSKANSEAEYLDLKTIWDRTIDAIDTIIRRDESTESGEEFLQPCIEAALNLGCTPRRASRSQRHNPRFYLSSSRQQASETSGAPHISDNTIYQGPSHLLPSAAGNAVPSPSSQFLLNYSFPGTSTVLTCLGSDSGRSALQGKSFPHEQGVNPHLVSCHGFPHFENRAISCHEDSALNVETYPLPSLGRTYPLYYSSSHLIVEPNHPFANSQDSNRDRFIVNGPPQPIADAKTGFLQNIPNGKFSLDASNRTARGSLSLGGTPEMRPDMGCDLSLRLGPLPVPCLNGENSSAFADVVSSSSRDGHRLCDLSPHRVVAGNFECSSSFQGEKEFCFFPNNNFDNTSEARFSKWNSAGGSLNMENPIRKRKAPISSSFEHEHFSGGQGLHRAGFMIEPRGQVHRTSPVIYSCYQSPDDSFEEVHL